MNIITVTRISICLWCREHVLHHHQDQHPTSAGHNDAQQPTTAERAYHAVVDPMKDAVQSIKDDAAWAYQHTREELFDKSAQETRHEMEPKTGGEWERAHGGVPSSTAEQVLVPPPVRDI